MKLKSRSRLPLQRVYSSADGGGERPGEFPLRVGDWPIRTPKPRRFKGSFRMKETAGDRMSKYGTC